MDVRDVPVKEKTFRRSLPSHSDLESHRHLPLTDRSGIPSPAPTSSLFRDSAKAPSWAREYSAKRDSGEGSLRPRFHMSWGAHWKNKSSVRGIHFAAALSSLLHGREMSYLRSLPTPLVSKGDARRRVSTNESTADGKRELFGLRQVWKGGAGSRIVNRRSGQHFDRPRGAQSLDSSGFGFRRAESHRDSDNGTVSPSDTQTESKINDHHCQSNANVALDSGEWYGLTSRTIPLEERFHKPRQPTSPRPTTGSPVSIHPRRTSSSGRDDCGSPNQPPQIEIDTPLTEIEDMSFGLKKSKPPLEGDSHVDASAPRSLVEPSQQAASSSGQPSNMVDEGEEEVEFGLKRPGHDRGRSRPDHSMSRTFQGTIQHINRPPLYTWSDWQNVQVEREMSSDPERPRPSKTRGRLGFFNELRTIPDRSFAHAQVYRDPDANNIHEDEKMMFKKPQPPHLLNTYGSIPTFHAVNQQTRQPDPYLSSSDQSGRISHIRGAMAAEALAGFTHPRPDGGMLASRAFSQPSRRSESPSFPSLRLERGLRTETPSPGSNSVHAWEEASLKLLQQAGISDNDAASTSSRGINTRLAQSLASFRQRREPVSTQSFDAERQTSQSDADSNPLLSAPLGRPGWYRKPDAGVRTFGSPKEPPDAPSHTLVAHKPDMPFSKRLRQSRAAIAEQVHKQLDSYTRPVQSAIGRLPQFQKRNVASSKEKGNRLAELPPRP